MKTQKKLQKLEIKLSKILDWWIFGNYKTRFSWNWIEFYEHKNYNFWDNIRDIDWKASSKTWELFVKKYELEKDLNILFVLDDSLSMHFWTEEKTKKNILEEVFYLIASSANANNDNVWAIIYDEKNIEFIENKKSKENIYRILEKLEKNVDMFGKNILNNNILEEIIKRKIKNNLIFFLTDKTEDFDEKKLKIINNQNEIIIINIFDYFENNLVNINSNISLKLWNFFSNISLSKKNKVEEYKKLRKKKLEELKYNFNKINIWYLVLDTKNNILEELIKFFSGR